MTKSSKKGLERGVSSALDDVLAMAADDAADEAVQLESRLDAANREREAAATAEEAARREKMTADLREEEARRIEAARRRVAMVEELEAVDVPDDELDEPEERRWSGRFEPFQADPDFGSRRPPGAIPLRRSTTDYLRAIRRKPRTLVVFAAVAAAALVLIALGVRMSSDPAMSQPLVKAELAVASPVDAGVRTIGVRPVAGLEAPSIEVSHESPQTPPEVTPEPERERPGTENPRPPRESTPESAPPVPGLDGHDDIFNVGAEGSGDQRRRQH